MMALRRCFSFSTTENIEIKRDSGEGVVQLFRSSVSGAWQFADLALVRARRMGVLATPFTRMHQLCRMGCASAEDIWRCLRRGDLECKGDS